MPSKEAGRYGDKRFVAMMSAKVLCVQLINMLGYNVLFQVSLSCLLCSGCYHGSQSAPFSFLEHPVPAEISTALASELISSFDSLHIVLGFILNLQYYG